MFNPGIIGFIFALVVVIIFLYNRFIVLRQRVKNAWSQIDMLLIRRAELVPALVETVKTYARHEQDVFINMTIARNMVEVAATVEDKAEAETDMTKSLKGLFAVVENYPELKADRNFLSLQNELRETENKISVTRKFYNDTVQKYNTKIEMFPNNLLASLFKFEKAEYFNLSDKATRSIEIRKKKIIDKVESEDKTKLS